MGLTREAQKRETGSIDSEEYLVVDLGGLGSESVTPGYHLESLFLSVLGPA